jgi:hypothetical protein
MGHSWVDIEVSSLERKKFIKLKALVDTEATLTALPEKLLKKLESNPSAKRKS